MRAPNQVAVDPLGGVVAFGRILRRAGLSVGTGRLLLFSQALALVDARRRDDVYWAGRGTLVSRPEDLPIFDAAFSVFWDRDHPGLVPEEAGHDDDGDAGWPEEEMLVPTGATIPAGEADDSAGDESVPAMWSPIEVLRGKDFADYDPEEYLLARRLMARLRATPPRRASRRPESAHRGRLDLRRTLRGSLRTAGVPIERSFLRRGTKPRRLVLIADVSGSMERYSRALLQFLHAAVAGNRYVEAFVFGTRLTRVTRELRALDPDRALRDASRAVVDWGGGTRIGDAVLEFNERWGQRGMARGAVVVILSDGWERGGADILGEQMARLHRLAWRVVWVNPLKAFPGYAPVAAGMAAALPHLDHFVAGHNLASLEELCALLEASTT